MPNPYVAAALNLVIYGAGYVYNGNRAVLGYGLVLITAVTLFSLSFSPAAIFNAWTSIPGILFGIIFAADAYTDAVELNKKGR